MRSILKEIKLSSVLLLLLGSAILAFGLYNIHSMSNVTEGGILGLTLLLEYWFGISPSVSGFVLTILCYFLGWKLLGKRFLICGKNSLKNFANVGKADDYMGKRYHRGLL